MKTTNEHIMLLIIADIRNRKLLISESVLYGLYQMFDPALDLYKRYKDRYPAFSEEVHTLNELASIFD